MTGASRRVDESVGHDGKPRHPIMEIFFNFFDKEEEKEEVEFEFVFERKLFK